MVTMKKKEKKNLKNKVTGQIIVRMMKKDKKTKHKKKIMKAILNKTKMRIKNNYRQMKL